MDKSLASPSLEQMKGNIVKDQHVSLATNVSLATQDKLEYAEEQELDMRSLAANVSRTCPNMQEKQGETCL